MLVTNSCMLTTRFTQLCVGLCGVSCGLSVPRPLSLNFDGARRHDNQAGQAAGLVLDLDANAIAQHEAVAGLHIDRQS